MTTLTFIFLTPAQAAVPATEGAGCRLDLPDKALTLARAYQYFLRCNSAVIDARAASTAAAADLRSADHAPNPVLGLEVSNINPKAGIGPGPLHALTVDSEVRVDQVVERGGKRAARRAMASANVTAAEQNLLDVTRRGAQALFEAYLSASAASETAELLSDAAASYASGQDAMNKRLGAGDVASIEVERASLDTARAQIDAATAALAAQQARGALSAAMGTNALDEQTSLLSVERIRALSAEPSPVDSAPEAVLAARPDVQAAAAKLEAARGALAVADAARHRDVDVTLAADHWPTNDTNMLGTGDSYTIGFSFPLFLYDSGLGAFQHARSDLEAAVSELRTKQSEAELDVGTALEQYRQAQSFASRYREQLLPSANQILSAEDAAYRRGGASLLDLLDARRNARQVGVSAISAQRDALAALGRRELALGRNPLAPFLPEDAMTVAPSTGAVPP